jgi:hypothetical protein
VLLYPCPDSRVTPGATGSPEWGETERNAIAA